MRARARRAGLASARETAGPGTRKGSSWPPVLLLVGPDPTSVAEKTAPGSMLPAMPMFAYQELLPAGHHDDTPFKKLTADHVASFQARGKRFLEVAPEALTLLAKTAMRDIAHLLRPGHLGQLRAILDDPEASPNDRF